MKPTRHNTLVLGTVQLGLSYGIANRTGKPSREQAFRILETAWEAGVRHIDTAAKYGSEELIGDFIRTHGLGDEVRIMTKIDSLSTDPHWAASLNGQADRALHALHCERLDVLFLHNTQDHHLLYEQPAPFAALLADMPIRQLGVSVYEPAEAEAAADCGMELAIQFPGNLIDRRFAGLGLPAGSRYARSILQQGLLVADELAPTAPERVKQAFDQLKAWFVSHGVERLPAALAYALTTEAFDYFLIGVETQPQLAEILGILADPPSIELPADELTALFDWTIFDPRTW